MICYRFRAGIKDLEVMVQNVITSAFETVTTVEQGVELLDVYMHLSSREVSWHHLDCSFVIQYKLVYGCGVPASIMLATFA